MTNAKTQTRGHCQCCGRQQAVTRGTMAHHGYTVEQGYFNGVCVGHQYAPIEERRDTADEIIASVRKDAAELRACADRLERGEEHPEQIESGRHTLVGGRYIPTMVAWADANEYAREDAIKRLVWACQNRARAADHFANDLQQIADNFHGKPLQVVTVEAKAARIAPGETRMHGNGDERKFVAKYQDGARVYFKIDGGERIHWMGSQAWRKMQLV